MTDELLELKNLQISPTDVTTILTEKNDPDTNTTNQLFSTKVIENDENSIKALKTTENSYEPRNDELIDEQDSREIKELELETEITGKDTDLTTSNSLDAKKKDRFRMRFNIDLTNGANSMKIRYTKQYLLNCRNNPFSMQFPDSLKMFAVNGELPLKQMSAEVSSGYTEFYNSVDHLYFYGSLPYSRPRSSYSRMIKKKAFKI